MIIDKLLAIRFCVVVLDKFGQVRPFSRKLEDSFLKSSKFPFRKKTRVQTVINEKAD
jgi:hypothetical protein